MGIKETLSKVKENNKLEKELSNFTEIWKDIMHQTNTMNEYNKTFTFINLRKQEYGYSCNIISPTLSFKELDEIKDIIETKYGCMFIYKKTKFAKSVEANFIMNGFISKNFQVVKTDSTFKVYIGNSVSGNPILVDMRDYPHILLSGSNGSGKSRLLDTLIVNLICNSSPQDVQLYLVQLAKNDLVIYEDVEHCYAFCDDLKKTNIMMDYIISQMDEVSKLIRPLRKAGKGSDIHAYNKLNPTNKIPTRYIIFDEYASITDTSNDSNEIKNLKNMIVGKAERIAQYGRALGFLQCVCLQRAVATMLSPFVKSQSNLRISGKQNNQKSSEVAMDDPYVALDLEQRMFVYKTYDYDYIKTPYIDDSIILENIKPYLKPNHRDLFRDLEKINAKPNSKFSSNNSIQPKKVETAKDDGKVKKDDIKDKEIIESINKNQEIQIKDTKKEEKVRESVIKAPGKIVKNTESMTFSHVDPNIIKEKERLLKENISKIPNFVPYIPPEKSSIKIIDGTKLDLSKSEKPKKEGAILRDDYR